MTTGFKLGVWGMGVKRWFGPVCLKRSTQKESNNYSKIILFSDFRGIGIDAKTLRNARQSRPLTSLSSSPLLAARVGSGWSC